MPSVRLDGCKSRPLLHYLKCLGVMRLVAMQADREARGAFRSDTFVLESCLDLAGIEHFFMEEYRPSPLLAPWNKGSGFWDQTSAGRALAAVEQTTASRFEALRCGISAARKVLAGLGLTKTPEKGAKALFIARLRARMPEDCLDWLDAAAVLTEEEVRFPALLGTGGNDGRLDFTANFLQHLGKTIGPEASESVSTALLRGALHGGCDQPLTGATTGQFDPGGVGGPNAVPGLEGPSVVNPWDFILAFEGALILAGAAVRRLGAVTASQASFPFMVETSGVGYATAGPEEAFARTARGEIWLPIWERPATFREIRHLFAEGRAQLGRRRARTGLDFVRSVRELGIDRGIAAFERYAFLRRSGLAYVAVAQGRVEVAGGPNPALPLLHELDPWIDSLRAAARRKEAPARLKKALLRLERAIFDFSLAPESRPLSGVLAEAGRTEQKVAGIGSPLQRLGSDWLDLAYDETSEFRIAAALAGLLGSDPTWRAYLEPVSYLPRRRGFSWNPDARGTPWAHRDLAANLARVLERIAVKGLDPFPSTRLGTTLSDIARFLDGLLDEERIAALLFGLVAVRPRALPMEASDPRRSLPRSYAVLKLLALPWILEPAGESWKTRLMPPGEPASPLRAPGRLHALLRSRRTQEALREALASLRAHGLETLVSPAQAGQFIISPEQRRRLAGALLIPIPVQAVISLAHLVLVPLAPVEGGVS